jgi:hypothetical protein
MNEPAPKVRQLDSNVSRHCRPTLQGLTTGTVSVNPTLDLEPVLLWGTDFCSWIGVLQELKFRPVFIVLTCLDSVELVKASVSCEQPKTRSTVVFQRDGPVRLDRRSYHQWRVRPQRAFVADTAYRHKNIASPYPRVDVRCLVVSTLRPWWYHNRSNERSMFGSRF